MSDPGSTNRRQLNATVFFPPLQSLSATMPPAALAALKTLNPEDAGWDLSVKDLNILLLREVLGDWSRFAAVFREELAGALAEPSLTEHEQGKLARLLHFHIPYLTDVLACRADDLNRRGDDYIKILYPILIHHFLGGLLTDGAFLYADPDALEATVTALCRDTIFTEFLDRQLRVELQVMGLSLVAEAQLPFALSMARHLKMRNRFASVVAGGPYITEMVRAKGPLDALFRDFDFLVAFEGETALLNLLQAISGGRDPDHPNVLSSSRQDLEAIHVEPIDTLGRLDFSDFDLPSYLTQDLCLPIYSSKGCHWGRCTFCSVRPDCFRERDLSLLVNDLQVIQAATQISHFRFVDDDPSPARLGEISRAINSSGLELRWQIQARLDRDLDYALLRSMKASGCYAIQFGLESGSPKVLRRIRKGIKLNTVRRILGFCEKLDYLVILNCMVGFPDETFDEACETAQFIDMVAEEFPGLRLRCNPQTVVIYKMAEYGSRKDIGAEPNPLSTTLRWDGPSWLEEFCVSYRDHRLFGTQHVPQLRSEELDGTASADPIVRLGPSWKYFEDVPFDLDRNATEHCGKRYLLEWLHDGRCEVFSVSSSMEFLLQILNGGSHRVSELRRTFVDIFSDHPADEVEQVFCSGVLLLDSWGVLERVRDNVVGC